MSSDLWKDQKRRHSHPWTPSPACSLVSARGFVDSCWSWLDAADAKDPVMCTINTISGWPRVGALTNILLKLNPRWPVIVSSFISLVTTWPSICANKQFLLWFYCNSSLISANNVSLTTVTTVTTVLLLPWCSWTSYFSVFLQFYPLIFPPPPPPTWTTIILIIVIIKA